MSSWSATCASKSLYTERTVSGSGFANETSGRMCESVSRSRSGGMGTRKVVDEGGADKEKSSVPCVDAVSCSCSAAAAAAAAAAAFDLRLVLTI